MVFLKNCLRIQSLLTYVNFFIIEIQLTYFMVILYSAILYTVFSLLISFSVNSFYFQLHILKIESVNRVSFPSVFTVIKP